MPTPRLPVSCPPSPTPRLSFGFGTVFGLLLLGGMSLDAPAQTATAEKPRAKAGVTLKLGDNGSAVEDLQRRLNLELDPAPQLDIDGDYGEATRAAVVRFQRAKGLRANGIADADTIRALGNRPLPTPKVPTPDEVNARVAVKSPADSLDGPPFVSAKAWAIADGRTGAILWGDHQADPLPMASTTKMMTALVVARIADRDPKALEEVITFSERADETGGSTSAVRAGERVSVRELLYGLMLPSGNDASVAFGEHFGGRLAPAEDAAAKGDPLPRFVAEMNRVARELGLKETVFANTHGLPASNHHSSARDLATLARHVIRHPLLAQVVSTSKHGCVLVNGNGAKRNIVWSNTNRLLNTEGYDGVKTGTTTAAGACLVASGHRDDDHLIVVILGAVTSDSRYLDAKNLFRWGWLRRGHTPSKKVAAGSNGPLSGKPAQSRSNP